MPLAEGLVMSGCERKLLFVYVVFTEMFSFSRFSEIAIRTPRYCRGIANDISLVGVPFRGGQVCV